MPRKSKFLLSRQEKRKRGDIGSISFWERNGLRMKGVEKRGVTFSTEKNGPLSWGKTKRGGGLHYNSPRKGKKGKELTSTGGEGGRGERKEKKSFLPAIKKKDPIYFN